MIIYHAFRRAVAVGLFTVMIALPSVGWSGTRGRGLQLPLATPLQIFSDALTGSVAFYVGVIAIAAGGSILAFGADLDKAVQRLAWALMAIGIAVNAVKILDTVFGATV